MSTPLPPGFTITLDPTTRVLDARTLYGGSPARALRLSSAGVAAWRELQAGTVRSPAAARLARTLTDAGLVHPCPPPGEDIPAVTVVVPVRDRPNALETCLVALGTRYPVIVVDDGSRSPAEVAAVATDHGAILLQRRHSGGPAAARNDGVAAVQTELVAFVDSDCVPTPSWIDELAAHFTDPLVGAVAPRVVAASEPKPTDRYAAARGSLDLGELPGRVAAGTRIAYAPTAALVARRTALAQVAQDDDVFDPGLRYGEDVDLVWRLGEAGWRIRYDPAVRVRHHEPTTWTAVLGRRFRYGTSAGPLARRHPHNLAPLRSRIWLAASVLAALAGRPACAVSALAVDLTLTHRSLRRAHLPRAGTVRATVAGAYHTWRGLARYATQFAAPLLLAGTGCARTRTAAVTLLVGPALLTWATESPALNPARFTLCYLADEVAYGAGVWAGSVRARTLVPLRPVIHFPTRKDTDR